MARKNPFLKFLQSGIVRYCMHQTMFRFYGHNELRKAKQHLSLLVPKEESIYKGALLAFPVRVTRDLGGIKQLPSSYHESPIINFDHLLGYLTSPELRQLEMATILSKRGTASGIELRTVTLEDHVIDILSDQLYNQTGINPGTLQREDVFNLIAPRHREESYKIGTRAAPFHFLGTLLRHHDYLFSKHSKNWKYESLKQLRFSKSKKRLMHPFGYLHHDTIANETLAPATKIAAFEKSGPPREHELFYAYLTLEYGDDCKPRRQQPIGTFDGEHVYAYARFYTWEKDTVVIGDKSFTGYMVGREPFREQVVDPEELLVSPNLMKKKSYQRLEAI